MTPSLRLLFYSLWIVPHALQLAVLGVMMRRSSYQRFPVFTAYTAFAICNFIALFVINWSKPGSIAYFHSYSLALGIDTALRFGIVCELFAHVFGNHSALKNVQKPLLRLTTVAFLIIAFSFAIYTHPSGTDQRWFTVHVLERSANIVLCGLILALFLFSYYLNLSWNRPIFGMASGLGILCAMELATTAIRSQIGFSAHLALDMLAMGTYLCCVLIWLFYLLTPERRPPSISDDLLENDLEAWNNELEGVLTR